MFNLPTSLGDGTWRQPTFVPQISNEIIELVRMSIPWPVWRRRQQFEKAQPVGGDLHEKTTRPLSTTRSPPPSLMAHPVPSGLFNLPTSNLIATGHIKPLGDNKQFASNTQQRLPSKTLGGAMREIALSLSRSRGRLMTCPDLWIGE
jgi:hypothetical protein